MMMKVGVLGIGITKFGESLVKARESSIFASLDRAEVTL
jgi:hypothetical protein